MTKCAGGRGCAGGDEYTCGVECGGSGDCVERVKCDGSVVTMGR